MKAYLSALWAKLITKEKALFKSVTIYVAAALAAAPDVLTYAQANFPGIAPYLPKVLQDQGVKWIALAVFVARMSSMVRIAKQVQP